jgi:hypothetical protein
LVTVSAYTVAGSQVLVPQRIDPGRRSRELSDAQVTARQAGTLYRGSAEFRAVITDLPPAQRDVLIRLADWADTLEDAGLVKLATYRGKSMTTLLPRLAADDGGWSVSTATKGPHTYSSFAACSNGAPLAPCRQSRLPWASRCGKATRHASSPTPC